VRLKDLDCNTLQQFFNKKSVSGRRDGEGGGLSPKSLRNMRNLLNLIFKQAQVNQLITSNPLAGVKISKMEHKEMRVLSLMEQETLENVILASLNPHAYGVIIALNTGLRIGELLEPV
jgi:integrase